MTKIKFVRNIPRLLFTGVLMFLFVLWIGSVLSVKDGWQCLVSTSDFDPREALASETDFNETMTDSFLPNDTMWIEDTSAFRDSVFWITLSIRNTVRIAGFTMAITYDTSFLAPEYWLDDWLPCDTCPPETSWGVFQQRTERTDPLTWTYWAGGIHNKHLDTTRFFAGIITGPNLPVGRGAVVRIRFKVHPYAPEGESTPIAFVTGIPEETDKPNTFVDSLGFYDFIPIIRNGTFTVKTGGGPPNACPVFNAMPSQREVNQGATLQFDVTAHDPDGDSLTLYLDPLDAQYDDAYDFPTTDGDSVVTQTFTFSPTFAHGPGTIGVKFKAEDEHGCVSEQMVYIEIIETTQDYLIVSSEQGGVPGSAGRMVPFIITNSIPIYGFQFTLRWDASVVDVDSFVKSDATNDFTLWTNLHDSSGVATVLVASLQGQTIPAGIETVLYAALSVKDGAPPGEVGLQMEDAVESIDPELPSQSLGVLHGKFTIDLFGDAIIDGLVNVADVVGVVAYILDNTEFTSRQFLTADVTENDTVNVADLVGIVNIILHRWTGPSPSPYLGPAAIVRLNYEDLEPGTTGDVRIMADIEVPVAGAQIRIDYDPEQLSFQAPRLSDWSNQFIAEYRDDKQGKLIVVLYSMSNDPISPGEGNFLSLPAAVSPDVMDKINLELGEIVLADENAVEIPVDDGKILVPQAFELSQNYPNPFNPTTTIKFTLPARKDGGASLPTTLKIYNVLGEMVRTLVDEPMSPGAHQTIWDGKDGQGDEVASGVYFYRLKAGEFRQTKKMVLLK
jgi:hypothetical protein